jgi:D-alanyl-D-alanine carboxypeptidase
MRNRRPPRAGAFRASVLALSLLTGLAVIELPSAFAVSASAADAALDRAMAAFVATDTGPPGLIVMVQRGNGAPDVHVQGKADVATGSAPGQDGYMRLASVAKAVTGAVAVSVVAEGKLALDDTIGQIRPDLPSQWSKVTLGQLMQHTSGIPDFSQTEAFGKAVRSSLLVPPPPVQLLSYVASDPLSFAPGSKYKYSNSDNIIIGLMVETATGHPFTDELATQVAQPLSLTATTLPRGVDIATPTFHGYMVDPPAAPEDSTEVFAAGWAWTSGGIVSTPADANRLVRGYVAGRTTDAATRAAQFRFRAGSSEPPGPGKNSAGMSVFRYRTRCGTVYGHTGNTSGYTQFVAASADGARSVTVSANAQLTPKDAPKAFAQLRAIYELGVCAALAK